jgi:cellobiose transport system substrate-binding protein
MRTGFLSRPAVLLGISAVLTGSLLAGCGGDPDGGRQQDGPITLTVNLFGDFGYQELYERYRADHPNITIKQNVTDYNAHHNNLQARLLAGAGTADIEAIEIGQVAGFQAQYAKFNNYLEHGVDTSTWAEWKWRAAASPDGRHVFGVGTDLGGLALCYRSDYFAAAGLPTKREDVSALFSDWNSYVEVGKQFLARHPDKTVKWYDASSNVFSAIMGQAPMGFYDSSGNVVVTTNPAVKQAWDTAVRAIQAGQSAALAAFTPQWNTGFQKGQFATVTCPAWMTQNIRANAPDTAGKWDIARIPGTGGGNWGGSYLAVPTQGRNQQAAIDLAKWLTAPEQQEWMFKYKGFFPSAQVLWSRPDVANHTDTFFSDAPVGQIFSASAKALTTQPLGPHAGQIGNAIGNALVSIEQGKATPDEAWTKALADIKNLTG